VGETISARVPKELLKLMEEEARARGLA